jgi:cation diffusion facilitator CzcD-associated flavoprotein CzcO
VSPRPHIAILGAGPVGLDAALAARAHGFPFTLFEAGDAVAANVRAWQHVRLFTPWSMLLSDRMVDGLERASRVVPQGDRPPTGAELVDQLLEPLAELPGIGPHLRCGVRVRRVARQGLRKNEEIATAARAARPFRLLLTDREGVESIAHAAVVLDCTGTYGNPNSTGDGGIPAPGEKALERRIVRFLPDFAHDAREWAGRTILLVGGGHSAQTAARDLAELAASSPGMRVHWVLRGGPDFTLDEDPLPERARLHERARQLAGGGSAAIVVHRSRVVEALRREGAGVVATLRARDDASAPLDDVMVDRVLSLTGGVGDHKLYRELQVHECYAFSAPMKLSAALLSAAGGSGDCLDQQSHGVEALRNPEPGFFILGAKSYGLNPTFLVRVGYQQVDEVFAELGAADPLPA